MCTFGLSGCRVKPRRPTRPGRRSSHTTAEDPQEREERKKIVAEREKKARNFGPPTLRGPTLRCPTLWAPPFGAHLSGFGPPTLRGPPRSSPHPSPTIPGLGSCFFCPVCQFLFCPNVVFFVPFVIFLSQMSFFLSRLCFFCPGCNFLFCPDNRLLILSRFRFFCPVAFFLSRASFCTSPNLETKRTPVLRRQEVLPEPLMSQDFLHHLAQQRHGLTPKQGTLRPLLCRGPRLRPNYLPSP